MGVVSTFTFTSDTETVTKTKLNNLVANLKTEFNGSIDNSNIKAAAGIVGSKLDLSEPGAIGGTTPAAITGTTLKADTSLELASGATVTAILDEDAMGTDSATALATQQSIKAYSDSLMPSGAIILWSGAISAIPSGFVLCDGNNGTPDLTDRFVIHADADSGGTNDVGDMGGAKTVSLDVAHLPAHTHGSVGDHTHGVKIFSDGASGQSSPTTSDKSTVPVTVGITSSSGGHIHTSVGSGTAHSNRDKYYALAYIMKT